MKPSRESPQFKIRLEESLLLWLKGKASENCRSITGEINARLMESRKKEEAINDRQRA